MRSLGRIIVVVAAIAACLYVAYLLLFPSVTLRYRLTVDVDVDGVTRSGSGVVEIFYQPLPDWLTNIGGGSHFGGEMTGYAITVDLGERGLLFVVDEWPILVDPKTRLGLFPKAARLTMLPYVAYGKPQSGQPSAMLQLARQLQQKKGAVEIPAEKLPMLVRFKDIGDRGTVEPVNPLDLAATYGPGCRFLDAKFEFTSDPVTPMPSVWPAWLKADTNGRFRFPPNELWAVEELEIRVFKGD